MKSILLLALFALSFRAGAITCQGALDVPLRSEYLEKLAVAAESLSADESYNFVADPEWMRKESSLSREIRAMIPYLSEGDISLSRGWQSPQGLTLTSAPGFPRSGLVVLGLDVFPMGYFLKRQKDRVNGVPVVREQPWFEWKNGGFIYHKTGGSPQVLETLLEDQEKLSLYRGTTNYEMLLLEFAKASQQGEIRSSWREELAQALHEIVEHSRENYSVSQKLFEEGHVDHIYAADTQKMFKRMALLEKDRRDQQPRGQDRVAIQKYLKESLRLLLRQSPFLGVFTTTSAERATEFSKGQVVHFEVSAGELRRLAAARELFVGFEKIGDEVAYEVGFMKTDQADATDSMLEDLIRFYQSATATPAGTLFN